MSTDVSSRGRVPAGVRQGGEFTTEQRRESDVSLVGAPPAQDDAAVRAARHWSGDTNERRAGDAISRMDGVESVEFDDGVAPVTTGHGVKDFGKTGTIRYKGHEFPFAVFEGVGTISGTGYLSVKNAAGREIGRATYSIPKTDGGRAGLNRDDLGETLETSVARALMLNSLQDAHVPMDGSLTRMFDRVRTTGGKVWIILPGSSLGDSDLYFHGGRTWRGHGGPAYGSKAQQQESVVRALGGGDLARGKKTLAQIDDAMRQVQAEHDAAYPPTPQQLKRRRQS